MLARTSECVSIAAITTNITFFPSRLRFAPDLFGLHSSMILSPLFNDFFAF